MPPVTSLKNQYLGINAHLHSFLQATGAWNRFHNVYITHLMETLRERLLPLGYVAEIEESLQILRLSDDLSRRPKSDVVIYDTAPQRGTFSQAASPVAEWTVEELLEQEDTEHPYFAVTLHPLSPNLQMGDAVVWIELLSPTNKGKGDDAQTYLSKRRALLETGIVFIELDYLHETSPTFMRLLNYADAEQRQSGAQPYRIVVLDPRPDVKVGPADVHQFAVDLPIPTVLIPLNGGDSILFDFGLPYKRMFQQGFYGYNLDYRQLPMNFDRYSTADQTRIAARMLSVLEAQAQGVDLETGPFPVRDDLSLEQIMTMLQAFKVN